MINKALFSSESTEWGTPQKLFNELDDVFDFDLDVCATDKNAKCKNYFTKEIDGLIQDWYGTFFMNPPYARKITALWVEKAWNEIYNENASTGVCLLPTRTEMGWFQDVVAEYASAVTFIRGRLKFEGAKYSAPFPSCIVVFGELSLDQKKILITLGCTITADNSDIFYTLKTQDFGGWV